MFYLVAEWIQFTLLGIILPTIKPKVYTFWGLMNSATRLVYDHAKDRMYHCSREALGLPSGNIGFGILRNMLP